MSCVFPYKNLVVGVPEANAPITGGADTDVTLPCMLTERKAWHQVFMAHKLTWGKKKKITESWTSAKSEILKSVEEATDVPAGLNHKELGMTIWDLNRTN